MPGIYVRETCRSENADYQYNKKRLREIDRRVRYLTKCMENLKIVDYSPQQEGKVFFGAWVEIENDDGVTHRFRIVLCALQRQLHSYRWRWCHILRQRIIPEINAREAIMPEPTYL